MQASRQSRFGCVTRDCRRPSTATSSSLPAASATGPMRIRLPLPSAFGDRSAVAACHPSARTCPRTRCVWIPTSAVPGWSAHSAKRSASSCSSSGPATSTRPKTIAICVSSVNSPGASRRAAAAPSRRTRRCPGVPGLIGRRACGSRRSGLWRLKTPSAELEFAQSGFALSSATVIRTDVFFVPHRRPARDLPPVRTSIP